MSAGWSYPHTVNPKPAVKAMSQAWACKLLAKCVHCKEAFFLFTNTNGKGGGEIFSSVDDVRPGGAFVMLLSLFIKCNCSFCLLLYSYDYSMCTTVFFAFVPLHVCWKLCINIHHALLYFVRVCVCVALSVSPQSIGWGGKPVVQGKGTGQWMTLTGNVLQSVSPFQGHWADRW